MKKFILLIIYCLILLIIVGCQAQHRAFYKFRLSEVKAPDRTIVDFEITDTMTYSYKDDIISVMWSPGLYDMAFRLENLSNQTIKLNWDEVTYIDENKESHKIMHTGIKYIDCEKPQTASMIIGGGHIDDIIAPCDNIHYAYGKWEKRALFPVKTRNDKTGDFLENTRHLIGKTTQVYLPLYIGGNRSEYIFSFEITDIQVK